MNESGGKSVRMLLTGHSKLEIKLVAYIVLLFVIASGLFIYMDLKASFETSKHSRATVNQIGETSTAGSKPDPTPSAYTKKTFHGHDFQVTLKFDPNATGQINYDPVHETQAGTYDKGIDELDIVGKYLGSSKPLIVSVIVRSQPTLSTALKSPQGMQAAGVATAFNATIMGKQHTAYYYESSTDQLLVNVPVGKVWYEVDIKSRANIEDQGYPITQSLATPILSSISIK